MLNRGSGESQCHLQRALVSRVEVLHRAMRVLRQPGVTQQVLQRRAIRGGVQGMVPVSRVNERNLFEWANVY